MGVAQSMSNRMSHCALRQLQAPRSRRPGLVESSSLREGHCSWSDRWARLLYIHDRAITIAAVGFYSRLAPSCAPVLEVLQQEGYIRGYSSTDFGNGRTEFEIELKYLEGQPVIRQIERVSSLAVGCTQPLTRCLASPATWHHLVSNSKGVMADHSARGQDVGGEVFCRVFRTRGNSHVLVSGRSPSPLRPASPLRLTAGLCP